MMVVKFICSVSYRIFWESKNFEGNTDKVEPWYGTTYSIERITSSTIQVCISLSNCAKLLEWTNWIVCSLHNWVHYFWLYITVWKIGTWRSHLILYLQEWVLSTPKENLHLPAPNIFIPTDLSLKNVQEKVKHMLW